jgi:hypothetical protein
MSSVRAAATTCLAIAVTTVTAGSIAGCKSKDAPPSAGGDTPSVAGSAAAAAPAAGSSLLTSGFEGEVDFVYTAKGEEPTAAPVPVAILVKGPKARADVPPELAKATANPFASGAYIIVDGDTKKLYAVLDARKEVVSVDLNHAGQDMGAFPPSQPGDHGPGSQRPETKITRTGHFETVAGYKCEDWTIASDHKEADLCVAEQGFSWFNFPFSGLPGDRKWASALFDGTHFPLRFMSYAKDGVTELSKVEITKLEKKDVADAKFQYPSTYAVMDVAQMFRAFGGMGGMGGRPMHPGMPPGMPPGFVPGMTMPPRGKAN